MLLHLVGAAWLILAAPSVADGPPQDCAKDDPRQCSIRLKLGKPAPFEGTLITDELAISLGQKAKWCDVYTKLKLDYANQLREKDKQLYEELQAINTLGSQEREEMLQKQLEMALRGPPWYERPSFVVPASVVATAGVFALAIKLVVALH